MNIDPLIILPTSELNSRYSQVDNELAEAALKFQEIKNSDSEPQRDSKLDVPKRYYSKSTQVIIFENEKF